MAALTPEFQARYGAEESHRFFVFAQIEAREHDAQLRRDQRQQEISRRLRSIGHWLSWCTTIIGAITALAGVFVSSVIMAAIGAIAGVIGAFLIMV